MVREKRESGIRKKIFSGLASVIFLAAPTITQAHNYYSPIRNRVRHSIYAFNHKNPSGLISGYLKHSPYAFNHKNNGIVSRNVRWSPYAFNTKTKSGLIEEHSHNPPYCSLIFHKHSCCPTIVTSSLGCWPKHNYFTNKHLHLSEQKTLKEKKRTRKQNLAIQQKSKTPISEYAKAIHKYLSLNEIKFTRNGGVFFLPKKKKIILSPNQKIESIKNHKEYLSKGWEIHPILLP